MPTKNLIAINEFCSNHNIDISFIGSLQQSGMIEITTVNHAGFIDVSELQQLEKIIHLYYELDINLEGIETITHLLLRINSMHDEVITLKNRLRLYETHM
jgi:hypothetical protein